MAVFGVTLSVLRRPGVEVTPFSVFLSPPPRFVCWLRLLRRCTRFPEKERRK